MLATLRDIAIIIVAVLDIVLLLLLVFIAFVVWKILALFRTEILPVVEGVKRTVTTVEGTTDFVSTTAAMPLIKAVSLVFAATRFVQVLLSRGGQGAPRT